MIYKAISNSVDDSVAVERNMHHTPTVKHEIMSFCIYLLYSEPTARWATGSCDIAHLGSSLNLSYLLMMLSWIIDER